MLRSACGPRTGNSAHWHGGKLVVCNAVLFATAIGAVVCLVVGLSEFAAVGLEPDDGWVFTDGDGQPIHPHALSQAFERIARRAGVPVIRLHDLRHHPRQPPHQRRPVKVVSERLGYANIAFTIETYQHVLPGMQADAARTYQQLASPVPPRKAQPVERRRNSRRNTASRR